MHVLCWVKKKKPKKIIGIISITISYLYIYKVFYWLWKWQKSHKTILTTTRLSIKDQISSQGMQISESLLADTCVSLVWNKSFWSTNAGCCREIRTCSNLSALTNAWQPSKQRAIVHQWFICVCGESVTVGIIWHFRTTKRVPTCSDLVHCQFYSTQRITGPRMVAKWLTAYVFRKQ